MIPYSKTQKIILGVVATACVGWVVATSIQRHYRDKVIAAESRADEMAKQLKSLEIDTALSRSREAQLKENLAILGAELQDSKGRLAKIPKPIVKPVPHGDDQVKAELQSYGFNFQFDQFNALTVEASRSVLEAFNHIPAYTLAQKRIEALEDTLAASDVVVEYQCKWLLQKDETIETLEKRIQLGEKRGEVLDQAIKDMRKQQKASEVKWWLKVGGAVATGYLVGRATRK